MSNTDIVSLLRLKTKLSALKLVSFLTGFKGCNPHVLLKNFNIKLYTKSASAQRGAEAPIKQEYQSGMSAEKIATKIRNFCENCNVTLSAFPALMWKINAHTIVVSASITVLAILPKRYTFRNTRHLVEKGGGICCLESG